jgi:hypothetical protein
MKRCPNPDCPAHQGNRRFYDDDTICPRCGEVLENPTLAAGGVPVAVNAYTGQARVRRAVSANDHGMAMLGAVGTILLVLVIIGLLRSAGMIGLGSARTGTVTGNNGVSALVPPAQQTATAVAFGTALSLGTPIATPVGGFANPSATPAPNGASLSLPTLPPLPTPIGGLIGPGNVGGATTPGANPGGSGNVGTGTGTYNGTGSNQAGGSGTNAGSGSGLNTSNPGNGAMLVTGQLCRQTLVPGQLCEPVAQYGAGDTFALAVQSTFGTGAANKIRVRLYGPPDGNTYLVEQSNTPGRDGRYWVGFAFQQNTPWAAGAYRADIFVNDDAQRTTYVTWQVK